MISLCFFSSDYSINKVVRKSKFACKKLDIHTYYKCFICPCRGCLFELLFRFNTRLLEQLIKDFWLTDRKKSPTIFSRIIRSNTLVTI